MKSVGFLIFVAAAVLATAEPLAFGHGFMLSLQGNQIVGTSSDYPANGDSSQFARALNGSYVQTSGGVEAFVSGAFGPANGDTLELEFVTPLFFSNGGPASPAPVLIALSAVSYPSSDYSATPLDSMSLTGTSGSDFLDVSATTSHSIRWTLTGGTIPAGVYGFAYQTHGVNGSTDEDYEPSSRLVVLYNTPEFTDPTSVLNARAQVYAAVPEPSGLVTAGLGVAVLAALKLRRRTGDWHSPKRAVAMGVLAAVMCAICSSACGHGFLLTLSGGAIEATSEVAAPRPYFFVGSFETELFSDHGGVEIDTGDFGASDTFSIDFAGPLWYSDGGPAAHAQTNVRLDAESYNDFGGLIGTATLEGTVNDAGEFEVAGTDSHSVGWILTGPSQAGVYGFSYRVKGLDNGSEATPFGSSTRLVVAFQTPGFTSGSGGTLAEARIAIFNAIRSDLNDNGVTNADDIDLLTGLISSGNLDADLNGDHAVNQADKNYMVSTILGTRYGDAQLDGDVDGADYDRWRLRPGYSGPGTGKWSAGDFDGDGDVDGADFDLWRLRPSSISGYSQVTAVPEPATWLLLTTGILMVGRRARRSE